MSGAPGTPPRVPADPATAKPSRVERLDAFQQRHSVLGFPLGVIYKFTDDRGPHLAAVIAYYAVVSIFPLLLLLVSAAGFVLQGSPGLQQRLINAALTDFPPLRGTIESRITGFHGSGLALTVGVVGTLYGGLGVMQAAQAAFNRIYGVPRNEQPNPLRSRLRSLLLLLLLGGGVLATTALSAAIAAGNRLVHGLGTDLHLLGLGVSLLLNIALFSFAFELLTARDLHLRQVVRGGIIAGTAWQGLQYGGGVYLSHEIGRASELYGTFGLVLGLIAWIFLEAFVVVLAAEVNVVASNRLWPRALLTPFTDAVTLTAADRRCYEWYARTERYKGTTRVEVHFPPEEPAAATGTAKEAEEADGGVPAAQTPRLVRR